MRVTCVMALGFALLTGCGGATSAEGSPGGTGGRSGAAGTGGTGGTAGAGGSGGTGCARTNDAATIGVSASWNGAAYDCDGFDAQAGNEAIALDGTLVAVTPGSFTIDECPPGGAPCAPELTTFAVSAPGLTLALPEGAFVHVKYRAQRFFACTKSLEVGTVATWYGVPNPAGPSGVLLLAITDGGGAFDDSPYTVDRRALGCQPDAGPGCGGPPPDEYELLFAPTAAPAEKVHVAMGQTKPFDLLQGASFVTWNVRNLRSFQTTACDDYWNFAYFIAWQPPAK